MTGYRIGPLAYLTDFKTIEESEVEKLARRGACGQCPALRPALLALQCGRGAGADSPRAPREAYLTHMSHDIGLQAVTEPTLPPHVYMACDTLELEINDGYENTER